MEGAYQYLNAKEEKLQKGLIRKYLEKQKKKKVNT